MSVSYQANNVGAQSSRRRRRGGGGGQVRIRRVPDGQSMRNISPTRECDAANGSTVNGGGGRGHSRRTLWEDKDSSAVSDRFSQSSALNAKALDNHNKIQQSNGTATIRMGSTAESSSAGATLSGTRWGVHGKGNFSGGTAGGDGGNDQGVNPAMLESEFLAATGQVDAGMDGPAVSLSLEEVPYDRDVRWCNTASDLRPRPTMNISRGVFGRIGRAITHDTGDYERLDRHYQELWKDREEPPGATSSRGRGLRTGRGGRGTERGVRRSAATRIATGRGDSGPLNRANAGVLAARRGVGGGGQSRGPPLNSMSRQTGDSPSQASRGGGEGGFAVDNAGLEAGGRAGVDGSLAVRESGRFNGKRNDSKTGKGIGGRAGDVSEGWGALGCVGATVQAPRLNQQLNATLQGQQHHERGGYLGYNWWELSQQQGMQNGPKQSRNSPDPSSSFSPRQRAADGLLSQHQQWLQPQEGGGDTHRSATDSIGGANRRFGGIEPDQQHDSWALTFVVRGPSSCLSPPKNAVTPPTSVDENGRAFKVSSGVTGEGSSISTSPLMPVLPSLLSVFPPDSPGHLGDLAPIPFHSCTRSPPRLPSAVDNCGHSPTTEQSIQQGVMSTPQHRPDGIEATMLLTSGSNDNKADARHIATPPDGVTASGSTNLQLERRGGLFSSEFSPVSGLSRSTTSFAMDFTNVPAVNLATDDKNSLLGTPSSIYSSPHRSSKPTCDLSLLNDPGLDVDIQDICVDADLNANAPAFIPRGFVSG